MMIMPNLMFSMTRACAVVILLLSGRPIVEGFVRDHLHTQDYASRFRLSNRVPNNYLEHPRFATKALAPNANFLFPPIPEQEKDMSIARHLYPSFIVAEFFVGFRYWCRVGICLAVSSKLCDRALDALPPLPEGSVITLVKSVQPLCEMDYSLRKFFFREVVPSRKFDRWFVTPVIVEGVFRGIGHLLIQTKWRAGLSLVPFFRRWDLGLVFCISYAMALPCRVIEKAIDSRCFQSWFVIPIELLESVLWLRAVRQVLWPQRYVRFLETKETEESSNTPDEIYKKKLRQTILFAARLNAAKQFGLGHCPLVPGGTMPLSEGLRYAQACIGTFLESVLVQGRLATQRRNIWAPIGAHVAHNLVMYKMKSALVMLLPMIRPCLHQCFKGLL